MKLSINITLKSSVKAIRVLRPSKTVRVAASADRDAALQDMERMRAGLSAHLASTETALKSQSSAAALDETANGGPSPVTELDQANYWDFVRGAPGDQVVVVDCYTVNCGPCKMVYPKVVDMAERYSGQARFGKFLCSKENRELGVALGVKVAPTFFLYKKGEKVAEMTGAKADKLEELLKNALAL